jgi:itaconate CoA-transferase
VQHLGLEVLIPGASGAPSQRAFAPPLLMDDLPDPGPVPSLGQHTEEVLASLGYDRAHIADMRRQGAA